MRTFTTLIAFTSLTTALVAAPSPRVPICVFDPVKGEYICPKDAPPPLCKFDPVKGEYVCPPTLAVDGVLVNAAATKCGQEGLRKCTCKLQGFVCENGEWKLTHRCATGQQCDTKDGSLCHRTRGPGFSC